MDPGRGGRRRRGPAWRVDGWLASPVPDRDARVSQIFETPDAVWLVDQTRLHRVRGGDVDSIETGFEVSALQHTGRSIWCTTKLTGFMGGTGPLLRVDRETLETRTFELIAPTLVTVGGTVLVTHVVEPQWQVFGTPMGRRGIARLDGNEPEPIDLGEADVQRMIEHRGAVWLLTSAGAFSLDGLGAVPLPVPVLSYTGTASMRGSTWLLATAGAVRLRGGGMALFEIDHAARDVVRVRGETWILTSDADGAPGPAYRVRGKKAVAQTPSGAGVASVVEYDDATWFLTSQREPRRPHGPCRYLSLLRRRGFDLPIVTTPTKRAPAPVHSP